MVILNISSKWSNTLILAPLLKLEMLKFHALNGLYNQNCGLQVFDYCCYTNGLIFCLYLTQDARSTIHTITVKYVGTPMQLTEAVNAPTMLLCLHLTLVVEPQVFYSSFHHSIRKYYHLIPVLFRPVRFRFLPKKRQNKSLQSSFQHFFSTGFEPAT